MKDPLKRAIEAEDALRNLLENSVVIESCDDFTSISCVNEFYLTAFDIIYGPAPVES